jgi:hypothetical protein
LRLFHLFVAITQTTVSDSGCEMANKDVFLQTIEYEWREMKNRFVFCFVIKFCLIFKSI